MGKQKYKITFSIIVGFLLLSIGQKDKNCLKNIPFMAKTNS